jgi:hypothetical protein
VHLPIGRSKPQGPATAAGALGYKGFPPEYAPFLIEKNRTLKNDPSLALFETPFESQDKQGKWVRHPPN